MNVYTCTGSDWAVDYLALLLWRGKKAGNTVFYTFLEVVDRMTVHRVQVKDVRIMI